jgi:hypothetical protein
MTKPPLLRRSVTALAVVALAALALVAVPGPAGAQESGVCGFLAENYEGATTFTADRTTAMPGETITVLGTGWGPGEQVDIQVDGSPSQVVTADSSGEFEFPYTVPADLEGTVTITAVCGPIGQALTISAGQGAAGAAQVQVAGNQQLPRTGGDSFPLLRVGGLLVAAGALAVVAARGLRARRQQHQPVG